MVTAVGCSFTIRDTGPSLPALKVHVEGLPGENGLLGKLQVQKAALERTQKHLLPALRAAMLDWLPQGAPWIPSSVRIEFEGIAGGNHVPIESGDERGFDPAGSVQAPLYALDRLVLPDEVSVSLHNVLTGIQQRRLIYEQWGFKSLYAGKAPAMVINLSGPPGTGKTTAAHGVAATLGKRILRADYSRMESKFVGDSAKNIDAMFEYAANNDLVVLLDEADFLLSNRVAVGTASDHAMNAIRTAMLFWLERFEGVVIACTNRRESYDSAFARRILFDVVFPLPDAQLRARIFQQHIPSQAPVDSLDFQKLAELTDGFSGADIRNAVVAAATAAASADAQSVSAEHFSAAIRELIPLVQRSAESRWISGRLQPSRPVDPGS